jgi:hypothetical protein
MNERIAVIRSWHDAVNRGDAEALLALCDEDIEIGGPRGSAHGREVMRDWLARSGIRLEPRRWFAGEEEIVVEQFATWPDSESDQPPNPVVVASTFRVDNGLVSRVVRYETVDAALAMTGLTVRDEV